MSTPVVVIDTVPLALSSVAFNTAPQLKAPVSIAAIVGNDELTAVSYTHLTLPTILLV